RLRLRHLGAAPGHGAEDLEVLLRQVRARAQRLHPGLPAHESAFAELLAPDLHRAREGVRVYGDPGLPGSVRAGPGHRAAGELSSAAVQFLRCGPPPASHALQQQLRHSAAAPRWAQGP
ncbi:unnamed protein product, partial [Effrenium voratum]